MNNSLSFKTFIIVAALAVINTSAAFSTDYYWVGGSGDYGDYANHWATTSGGSVFHTVEPGLNDNVYFDASSFTAPGQIVSETTLSDITANNFTCSGTLFSPTFNFTGIPIIFNGSFVLDSGATWNSYVLQFRGTALSDITISTHGIALPEIIINYPLGAGIISLASELNCKDIGMDGGIFYSNNHTISMTNFDIIGTIVPPVIYFGTSRIFCYGTFDATLCGSDLHADSCTLIFNQDLNNPFFCSNQNFNHVIFSNKTSNLGQIYGSHANINLLEVDKALWEIDFYLDTCHIGRLVLSSIGALLELVKVDVDTLIFNNNNRSSFDRRSDTLTVNNLLIINPGTWLTGNVPYIIKKNTGQVCTDSINLQNIEVIGGAQFFAGINSIDNGGNTGWQFTACTPATSNVWPGDANYDLTADNLDLINIGINFGSTGAVRPSASSNWTVQPCPDWTSYFSNGANFKHADCNGDGVVDASDTLAVALNYGQTHPLRLSNSNSITAGGSDLFADLTGVSLMPGNTVTIPIKLGTASNSITALYGTAFTINYNPAYVDAKGVSVSYSNSWLSSGLVLTMAKDFPATGKTDLVIVRTDQTDLSGFGIMAEITFTIPLSATGNFYLGFSNIEASLSSGNELIVTPVNVGSPTQVFYPGGANSQVNFYPNPVREMLHISAEPFSCNKIIIRDIAGRIISMSPFTTEIDFSFLGKGIYFVELLQNDNLVARTKISRL